MTDKIVVLSTCDSKKQADQLAHHLVEKRLAACVNIVPGLTSVYRWKDKIENAKEWMLVIKSRRDVLPALQAEIEKVHTYEVPEVLVLTVIDGAERYLNWIDSELKSGD
jgi:periplasmic divalent cation tolerance protein